MLGTESPVPGQVATIITYELQQIIVTDVLTHEEYNRDKWKD